MDLDPDEPDPQHKTASAATQGCLLLIAGIFLIIIAVFGIAVATLIFGWGS